MVKITSHLPQKLSLVYTTLVQELKREFFSAPANEVSLRPLPRGNSPPRGNVPLLSDQCQLLVICYEEIM